MKYRKPKKRVIRPLPEGFVYRQEAAEYLEITTMSLDAWRRDGLIRTYPQPGTKRPSFKVSEMREFKKLLNNPRKIED